MGSVTIRKLDEDIIQDLRVSAAKRGVSMEQEARDRLRRPLQESETAKATDAVGANWNLKASVEEILAIGRRLPKVEFDQKEESDKLYDYLDEKQ